MRKLLAKAILVIVCLPILFGLIMIMYEGWPTSIYALLIVIGIGGIGCGTYWALEELDR